MCLHVTVIMYRYMIDFRRQAIRWIQHGRLPVACYGTHSNYVFLTQAIRD